MRRGTIATILLIVTILISSPLSAQTPPEDILNMAPDNAMFCVQINNLDASLGQTDQFLSGLAPVSVAMLLKMQLGQLLGDAMLKGVDSAGSFAVFGYPAAVPQQDAPNQMGDVAIMIALPIAGYDDFIGVQASRKAPDADGVSVTKDGKTLILPLVEKNIALMTQPKYRDQILALKRSAGSNPLAKTLDKAEKNRALTSPIWAYINVDAVNRSYAPLIDHALQEAQMGMMQGCGDTEVQAPEMMKIMTIYFDMARGFMNQCQYVSFGLNPSAAQLSMTKVVAAKPETTFASFLMPFKGSKGFDYAPLLNSTEACNMLMKYDSEMMRKITDAFFDAFGTLLPQDSLTRFRELNDEYLKLMGDEFALSFSFADGQPPMKMREFVKIKDPEKARGLMGEFMPELETMYRSMGLPLTLEYTPNTSTYNDVEIDTMQLKVEEAQANESAETQQMREGLNMAYGPEGLQYHIATVDKTMIVSIDPDQTAIHKLIYQAQNTNTLKPSRDMQLAFDLLPNAQKAEMVMTINYLRLIGGAMNYVKTMVPGPQGEMFASLAQLGEHSQSALVAAASSTEKDRIVADIVMPKAHVMEIFTAVMQVQAQMMQAKKQAQQEAQESPDESEEMDPAPMPEAAEPQSLNENQDPDLMSPDGTYILSIPFEEESWKVTIYDPENRSLYLDDSEFTGNDQCIWAWDDNNILWLYDPTTDTMHFWEHKEGSWQHAVWGTRSLKKIDRDLTPPAQITP